MFAIDEQHGDVDGGQAVHLAVGVHVQHLVHVGVHLPVFVLVEAADVALVVALEQRRQVFADGAVDQVAEGVAFGAV